MFRHISSLGIGVATWLAGSAAFAQAVAAAAADHGTLGRAGELAISADRLFGFNLVKDKETVTVAGVEQTQTTTYTGFSLLGRGIELPASPYSTPRLGVDYFVIDGLSIGGSITYMSTSGSVKAEAGGTSVSRDGPTFSTFVIAPRVGYALMFNDFFGIWPRGGITYYNVKVEVPITNSATGATTTSTTKYNGVAFTVEMPLVLSPAPHVAIGLGPTLDVPLSGTTENTDPNGNSESHDETFLEFGFQAGLIAWF